MVRACNFRASHLDSIIRRVKIFEFPILFHIWFTKSFSCFKCSFISHLRCSPDIISTHGFHQICQLVRGANKTSCIFLLRWFIYPLWFWHAGGANRKLIAFEEEILVNFASIHSGTAVKGSLEAEQLLIRKVGVRSSDGYFVARM